jgi:hypothetical protein
MKSIWAVKPAQEPHEKKGEQLLQPSSSLLFSFVVSSVSSHVSSSQQCRSIFVKLFELLFAIGVQQGTTESPITIENMNIAKNFIRAKILLLLDF